MYQFPENDFADAQSNFDPFPDLSVFDEWQLDEDSEHPVLMPHDSGPMPHPIYHASEVHDESGGSSSQFGGHAGRLPRSFYFLLDPSTSFSILLVPPR
ncbi:hypothetical protein L484_003778 [Morus notabilis]|uniref:Uncharacterized protein n=1 Tax=Morus notabilis TaxID=981085 RepID=W9QPN0_9ROSA|nr:hypothetical protein L484_003778 [Morus notabilis]